MSENRTPTATDILVDGFVARTFAPEDTTNYFMLLLRNRYFIRHFQISYYHQPHHQGAWFIMHNVNSVQSDSPGVPFKATPLLDYSTRTSYGTVVPQQRWTPADRADVQRHIRNAVLELPIFFVNRSGSIGFPLMNILREGCDSDLYNANDFASLAGKTTTHIRINWPGYRSWKRQIQTRDETHARNPITMARFMRHVASSVDRFFNECMSSGLEATDRRWHIGMCGGIAQHHVKVIGAIHVSAGTWMPILQINGYVV